MSDKEAELLKLLAEARRLNNQVCRKAREVDAWHIAADRALQGTPFDNSVERFDDPERVKHRRFVDSLFGRKR